MHGYAFQLTEDWGEALFSALRRAGGTAFSNMAVGYNNVDVSAANKYGIAVGNTPVSSFPVRLFVLCLCRACSFYKNSLSLYIVHVFIEISDIYRYLILLLLVLRFLICCGP